MDYLLIPIIVRLIIVGGLSFAIYTLWKFKISKKEVNDRHGDITDEWMFFLLLFCGYIFVAGYLLHDVITKADELSTIKIENDTIEIYDTQIRGYVKYRRIEEE